MIIFSIGFAALLLGLWLFGAIRAWRSLHLVGSVDLEQDVFLSDKPKVSILVPARNEEEIIRASIQSLLAQDYLDYEILVVNDDSTDRTGEILAQLASNADGKLRIIQHHGLPPQGWVGKTHALTLAAQQACGDWLFMSDADVIHQPRALSIAMSQAEKYQVDLFSLLPQVDCYTFWERLIVPIFGLMLSMAFPLYEVNDPKRNNALAVGGFILVRKKAFAAIRGYTAIKDQVAEDVLLGQLIKQAGFRIRLCYGEKLAHTRMYQGLRDLWLGLEKNVAAAFDFHWLGWLCMQIFFLGSASLPWLGMYCAYAWLVSDLPWTWLVLSVLSLVNGAGIVYAHYQVYRRVGVPALPFALLWSLAYLFFAAAYTNSLLKARLGSGVRWKGRKYYGMGRELPKAKVFRAMWPF